METEHKTDVIIAGSGSAGLTAAVWLSRMNVSFLILDKRSGPLQIGQADGVQCRTVEIFESFGLDTQLTKDAYWVNEDVFWTATGADKEVIERTRRTPDVLEGMSWQPHVILNQARLNGLLIGEVERASGRGIEYSRTVKEVRVDETAAEDLDSYPITAIVEDEDGKITTLKAKYLLGCDGAHSSVRKSLGYQMVGDTSEAVWGVMDIYPRTEFPDVRKKTLIRAAAGNLLIIPREGDVMCRFYIELPGGTLPKSVRLEDLQTAAKKIFSQFPIEFVETYWWSAYSIGQRLADHFTKDDRVFLTGDACHTHSPKGGQGMNLSLGDGYNIGWKLALVLKRQASPALLKTYTLERQKTAEDLIAFDRKQTSLLVKNVSDELCEASKTYSDHFIKSSKYLAGLTVTYSDSIITHAAGSTQEVAKNLNVGTRFLSAQVVRLFDVRAVQLSKALQSDGRWRLVVFAGDICKPECFARIQQLASFLSSSDSPIVTFTPPEADIDSVIEPILVLSGRRVEFEDQNVRIPEEFTPISGKWQIRSMIFKPLSARPF